MTGRGADIFQKLFSGWVPSKPHKMHGTCRWKARELGALREFERIKLILI